MVHSGRADDLLPVLRVSLSFAKKALQNICATIYFPLSMICCAVEENTCDYLYTLFQEPNTGQEQQGKEINKYQYSTMVLLRTLVFQHQLLIPSFLLLQVSKSNEFL